MKRAVALLGGEEVQSIMEREGKIEVRCPPLHPAHAAKGETQGHLASGGQQCRGLRCWVAKYIEHMLKT